MRLMIGGSRRFAGAIALLFALTLAPQSVAQDNTRTAWSTPDAGLTLQVNPSWERTDHPPPPATEEPSLMIASWQMPGVPREGFACYVFRGQPSTSYLPSQAEINEALTAASFEALLGDPDTQFTDPALVKEERDGVRFGLANYRTAHDDGTPVQVRELTFGLAIAQSAIGYKFRCVVAESPSAAAQLAEVDAFFRSIAFDQGMLRTTSQNFVPPDIHIQLVALMHTSLDQMQRQFAPDAIVLPGTEDHLAQLTAGAHDNASIQLNRGAFYRFISVCDGDCSNVDLELINPEGRIVAGDVLPDDSAMVHLTPAESGAFTVRMTVRDCRVAPCYAAWRVLQRER